MEDNRPLVSYCKGGIDSVVDKLMKNKISHPIVDPLLRDLQSLREDLVNKFAGRHTEHKQVKVWMKQIRELVYDIEDWMDAKLTTNMVESKMEIAQIEEFKTKLKEARARCQRYDLINKVPPSDTNPLDAAHSNNVAVHSRLMSEEKAVLVGVGGPKQKLEEHLKGQQKKRKVVSVLGVGGHGKTTLAKEVYEKLKGQFECHASVTVGRNTSTTALKEVLLQVDPQTDPNDNGAFMNEQEVILQLWEFLQTKRYFVFIDDICNTRAWSVINSALPNNDLGSRVLTTTRVKDVAMSCAVRSTDVVYEMEDLDEDDSRSLLLTTISTETEETQANINKICHDMIKISRGLPLTIIVSAGLIARKPAELGIRGKHEEYCLSTLDQYSTSEGMRKLLEICFADLSPPVKSCFVYMSVFPENYTIKKDRLIWRWISEGFIPKRGDESLWETAESYFNELLCRKLIRPEFDDYNDDMAVSCTVHCVIHDFITCLSRQENFLTTAAELISRPFPCGTIRRFSVNCSRQDANEADSLVSSKVHLSRLRSLIVFGGARRVPDLSLFKHLRVLDLEDNNSVDNQQLESIGLLSLLRYLGLAGTNVDMLPQQTIMALKYLVTLDLRRTRVTELLLVIDTELVSVLADGLKIPRGIMEMKELEELSTVSLFPEDGARLLSNSKRLRMLGVTFGNMHVPIEKNQPGLKHFLEEVGKSNLQSFLLDDYPSDSVDLLVDCSWASKRPHCLRKFELRMCDYLQVVPHKMASLSALTHLHIRVEQVEAQGVRALGSLPNLVLLKLFSCKGSQGRLTISSNDGFGCLKVFSFSCSIIFGMGLQFDRGAMRQLRRLQIDFSAKETKSSYGDFEFGIQHLYSLVEVRAIIRCQNAAASEVESVKAAIRDQASRIAGNHLEKDLPTEAGASQVMDSRNEVTIRTDRCSTSTVVTRISTLPESSWPLLIPEAKGKQVEVMVPKQEPDGIPNSTVGQCVGPNRDWTIDFDEGWAFIQQGINKLKNIIEGRPEPQFTSHEYMNLYNKVYQMCWQKPRHLYEEKLYNKYRESFEEYLTSEVLPSLREKHGEFVLRELVQRWSNNKLMARWMSRFFCLVDRYYISQRSLPTLQEVAVTCFRELVYQDIKGQVKDIVLELMQLEREGGHIDSDLLRNVMSIFVEIGFFSMEYYEDDIEMHLLKNTEDYYFVKAQSWIHRTARSDYLIEAEEYLKREQARDYLFGNTKELLLKKVQYELLGRYGDQILENKHDGFLALLRDEKVEDLSRMYRLFSNVSPCVKHMSQMFQKYITTEGKALVKQEEDCCSNEKPETQGLGSMQEQDFVWKLVELHEKYVTYVTECFQRHDLFHKALRRAFVDFCNMGVFGISNAEILSTFFDNVLTKDCSEKIGDEAIEDALRKAVRLLVHIDDKDLFATFYRKKLARRLLKEIANDELERIMFRLLKELFGAHFTSKMEGMVADLIVGMDHQTGFKEYLNKHPELDPSINMAVTVLTMGFWPSYKNIDMRLPADMAKCVEVFEKSYKERMSGRKLNWMYSMGSCNMDAKFGAKSIELIVTPCQAALLLLFNGCDRLSYSEIVTELNLPDDDFAKHLLSSVSCAKYKILNKYPNNTTISSSDVFEFNSEFSDRKRRVKIPVPHGVEKKKVVEEINMDRRYKIEASIVRIMKSRRVMGHTQLVTECVEQLSLLFKPDVPSIKKRIEDLIHREYMKRDDKNPNIYIYVGSWAEPEDTNERGQIDQILKK